MLVGNQSCEGALADSNYFRLTARIAFKVITQLLLEIFNILRYIHLGNKDKASVRRISLSNKMFLADEKLHAKYQVYQSQFV